MLVSRISSMLKKPGLRSMGIYIFTNFFGKAVSFLLLFIYTNPVYISPSENGLLSLMSNALVFFGYFISLGALHSVSTDFFKLDKEQFRDFFASSFVMPVLLTLAGILVLYIFRYPLQQQFGFPFLFIWLIPVLAFFTFCSEHLATFIRNNDEPNRYLGVMLTRTAIELGLSLVLVVFFAWRWHGRVAGILAAFTFSAAYAFYYFRKKGYLPGRINAAHLKSELVYAGPVILMQLSLFCLNSADKFFLSRFTSDNNATVGIYSTGYVFASVVTIFSTAMLQYMFPRVYKNLGSAEGSYRNIRKDFLYYVVVMCAGTLLMIVVTPLLYHFFIHEKYHSALRYIYLVCIGNFLWAVNYFFYSFFFFSKHKRKLLLLSVSSIIISTAFNYFLIKKYLAMGAAWATLLSYALVLLVTLMLAGKHVSKLFSSEKTVPA